jgi:hypothetical protein
MFREQNAIPLNFYVWLYVLSDAVILLPRHLLRSPGRHSGAVLLRICHQSPGAVHESDFFRLMVVTV